MGKSNNFKYLVWLAALVLACTSGWYSVYGLGKLFAGAGIAIYIMAIALESSKVIIATYLHRYWKLSFGGLKYYLTFGLLTLMMITSIGVYGFLTAAFQETSINLRKSASESEMYSRKIESTAQTIQKLDTLVKQKSHRLDLYDNLTLKQEEANIQSNRRRKITAEKTARESSHQIDSLTKVSSALSDSIIHYQSKIDSLHTSIDASELGPISYISKNLNFDLDKTINLFILLIVCVFDPLAISLVFAADSLSKMDNSTVNNEPNETVSDLDGDGVNESSNVEVEIPDGETVIDSEDSTEEKSDSEETITNENFYNDSSTTNTNTYNQVVKL